VYNAGVSRQAYLETSNVMFGVFSVELAAEERTTDTPENPDDTNNDEVWPDYSENVQNRVESQLERSIEERCESGSCYRKHISTDDLVVCKFDRRFYPALSYQRLAPIRVALGRESSLEREVDAEVREEIMCCKAEYKAYSELRDEASDAH